MAKDKSQLEETRMKTAIFLTAMLIAAPSQTANQIQQRSLDALCVDEITLTDSIIKEYGESAMLTMVSSRDVNGKTVDFATVMFVNPKTRSWTMVEKWDDKTFCIVGVGGSLSPYKDNNISTY
jgi:hypothetical protein